MQTGRRLEGCCLPRDLPLADVGGCLSTDITVRNKASVKGKFHCKVRCGNFCCYLLIVLHVFIWGKGVD